MLPGATLHPTLNPVIWVDIVNLFTGTFDGIPSCSFNCLSCLSLTLSPLAGPSSGHLLAQVLLQILTAPALIDPYLQLKGTEHQVISL